MTADNKKDTAQDWPKASGFSNSIRTEFSFYVGGLLLCLMIITGYFITSRYSDTVAANVVDSLRIQAHSFSDTAGKLMISSDNPDELLLNNICQKLANNNSDLFWAGIADARGTFLAHTNLQKVITGAKMNLKNPQISDSNNRPDDYVSYFGDTIFIEVPILENGVTVGWFEMASSSEKIKEARISTIITVATITAIMILIGIPLTLLILNRKLRPIKVITDGLKNIDYDNIEIEIPLKSTNEFGYLSETLKVMGTKLKSAQADVIENERISRELEIAREIQANILPKSYPSDSRFEFAGAYQSAREVGGDYYDFIEINKNNIAFLVADVSGKSLPGMLVMLLTRDIIRKLSYSIQKPSDLLVAANRELKANIKKGMFVTMFYGLLNRETGQFEYASAGHNPLIHINAADGKLEAVKTKGFPLGMVSAEVFEERMETGLITLNEGDLLIQYTDGINEAHNAAGQEYGMDRFIDSLKNSQTSEPEEIVGRVLDNHGKFVGEADQFDDITLLVMKWKSKTTDKSYSGKHDEIIVSQS